MRHTMPTGRFEMAPLEEFVVTVIDHTPQPIELTNWFGTLDKWPEYDCNSDTRVLIVKAPKPKDCKPYFQDYQIIFQPN